MENFVGSEGASFVFLQKDKKIQTNLTKSTATHKESLTKGQKLKVFLKGTLLGGGS